VWRRAAPVLLCLSILLMAALPRLSQIDGFSETVDENNWFERSSRFFAAVDLGDWDRTFRTGHPGVTVMWVSALGMGLEEARALNGAEPDLTSEAGREAFFGARRAMAVVASLLLVLIVWLIARLYDWKVAVMAAVLLALDPWLVAHSRVLHLDNLVASLVTVCVLACLVRWQRDGGPGLVVLAGIAAGLGVLTKCSALALLPLMLLLLAAISGWGLPKSRRLRMGAELVGLTVTAALVPFVLWPAMWSDPLGTTLGVIQFGAQAAAEANQRGSFFLGRAVEDPGPAYYPVVLAFRTSPLLVLGLVAGALALVRQRRLGHRFWPSKVTLGLLACVAIVVMVNSAATKKQDRYVLPAIPLLTIVSALGLRRAVEPLGRQSAYALLLGGVGLTQLLWCASARPLYFTAYSPLAGGPHAARQTLLVGWGEGLEPVVAYFDQPSVQQPRRMAASNSIRTPFQDQVRFEVLSYDERRRADLLVSYVSAEQRGQGPPAGAQRVLTVLVGGVEYAALYRLR
jgi:hypothetical protein